MRKYILVLYKAFEGNFYYYVRFIFLIIIFVAFGWLLDDDQIAFKGLKYFFAHTGLDSGYWHFLTLSFFFFQWLIHNCNQVIFHSKITLETQMVFGFGTTSFLHVYNNFFLHLTGRFRRDVALLIFSRFIWNFKKIFF